MTGWLIGLTIALTHVATVRADDPRFRDFPQQDAPRPADLARLLSELRIAPVAAPEEMRWLAELARSADPEAFDPESREAMRAWARQFLGPNGAPADPATRAALDAWMRSRNSAGPSDREWPRESGGVGPLGGNGRGPTAQMATPRDRPSLRRGGDPAPPSADRSLPPQSPVSPNPSATAPLPPPRQETAGEPSPVAAPQSRRELGNRMNEILLQAARRAAERERGGAPSAGDSGESFLAPLVERIRRLAAERGADWQRGLARNARSGGGAGNGARGRGFLSRALSQLNAGDAAPSSATSGGGWLFLVAGAAGIVALLLVLSKRVRERLATPVRDLSRRIRESVSPVESPDDFVRAFDRFVVAVFGPNSTSWHSRAVERALAARCPEARQDITRLVETYVIARFSPERSTVPAVHLRDSTRALRRIAETLSSRTSAEAPATAAAA